MAPLGTFMQKLGAEHPRTFLSAEKADFRELIWPGSPWGHVELDSP